MAFAEARTFTWSDIQSLPPDRLRRELLEGQLLVTPAPDSRHQRVVIRLSRILEDACPPGNEVLFAPFDWYLAEDTYFEPDLLVIPRPVENIKRFEGNPLLVAEVLSPSTRTADRVTKLDAYARGGAAHYWIVDPEVPDITALRLEGDRFVEVAHARGDEVLAVDQPFPVEVCPARLVD